MNRREWLTRAAMAVGALAVDPDKLLWTQKKTIFIPPPSRVVTAQTSVWSSTHGSVLGIAVNNIHAGNYGWVQVYGPLMTDQRYGSISRLFRSVRARGDIPQGYLVFESDVVLEEGVPRHTMVTPANPAKYAPQVKPDYFDSLRRQ